MGRRPTFVLALVAGAIALLAACDRPDWTEPERSKGPRRIATPSASRTISTDPGTAPAPLAWAAPLMGRRLAEVAPGVAACQGNADGVRRRYAGPPPAAELAGWGWDLAAQRRLERVVLIDAGGRIVGAGEGGRRRLDVPRALPAIQDPNTGWTAITEETGAIMAYGLARDGHAACKLGTLQP